MGAGGILSFVNENQQLDTVSNGNDVSEDCLTLNVIRPSGYDGVSLPVGVVSKLFLALILTFFMRGRDDLGSSGSMPHHVAHVTFHLVPCIRQC
jgi:hypothetical protein